jgi:hypothetical protein
MACMSGARGEHPRRMLKKAVRQGRSKRRGDAYSVRYGEPLSEARTPLADFFSILLGQGVWIGRGEVEKMVGDTGIEPVASSV